MVGARMKPERVEPLLGLGPGTEETLTQTERSGRASARKGVRSGERGFRKRPKPEGGPQTGGKARIAGALPVQAGRRRSVRRGTPGATRVTPEYEISGAAGREMISHR